MKRNKKIMSIVAGAAIVSQLLPMGTVIANAQEANSEKFTHTHMQVSTTKYANTIQLFGSDGQNGGQIDFDIAKRKIYVKTLGNCEEVFNKNDENGHYLKIRLIDEKGKDKKEVIINGGDHISKLYQELNATSFELGYSLRVSINSNNSSLVKITGYIDNCASCFEKGIPTDRLNRSRYIIGETQLSVQEDRH